MNSLQCVCPAGTPTHPHNPHLGVMNSYRVVVLTDAGDVHTVEGRNISALSFVDEKDRREIQKALQRSYQALRSESAFVDVTIVPNNGATKCAVQYVTTAPSPKTALPASATW